MTATIYGENLDALKGSDKLKRLVTNLAEEVLKALESQSQSSPSASSLGREVSLLEGATLNKEGIKTKGQPHLTWENVAEKANSVAGIVFSSSSATSSENPWVLFIEGVGRLASQRVGSPPSDPSSRGSLSILSDDEISNSSSSSTGLFSFYSGVDDFAFEDVNKVIFRKTEEATEEQGTTGSTRQEVLKGIEVFTGNN